MGQVVFIGFGGGGSGDNSSPLVYSVFGRDGTVGSLFGDYSASLIANDSIVDGASVAAALDTLAAPRAYTTNISAGEITAGAGTVAVYHDLNTDYPIVQVYGDDGFLLGDNDVIIELKSAIALHVKFLGGSPQNFASSASVRVVVMKPYA